MKIYLDTCSIQRPLDNKNQLRIVLEAEAVLGIIAACDLGQIELVSSEALVYETQRASNPMRTKHAKAILEKANDFVVVNDMIEQRSQHFVDSGLKPFDALHLASAEFAAVDYLCTCDDRFLKKAQGIAGLTVKVVSPVTFIEEIAL